MNAVIHSQNARRPFAWTLCLMVGAAFAGLAGTASAMGADASADAEVEADVQGNFGTVKVHAEATAEPPQRNQPHVGCNFYIEGFAMADGTGHLEISSWSPTGEKGETVLTAEWNGTAEAEGHGNHFLVGPLTLETGGHFRLEVFGDGGHPGSDDDHFVKAKMFWVDCAEAEIPDFATGTAIAAASALGVGAYAFASRRNKN